MNFKEVISLKPIPEEQYVDFGALKSSKVIA